MQVHNLCWKMNTDLTIIWNLLWKWFQTLKRLQVKQLEVEAVTPKSTEVGLVPICWPFPTSSLERIKLCQRRSFVPAMPKCRYDARNNWVGNLWYYIDSFRILILKNKRLFAISYQSIWKWNIFSIVWVVECIIL